MAKDIGKLQFEIQEQRNKQLEIARKCHALQKENASDKLAMYKDELNRLSQQKQKIEHEILVRNTQLNAMKHELHERDANDINNLDLLLKRAQLLEAELNDANYYDTNDKLQIMQQVKQNKSTKSTIIQNAKLKFEKEQQTLSQNIERLQQEKEKLAREIDSKHNIDDSEQVAEQQHQFDISETEENLRRLYAELKDDEDEIVLMDMHITPKDPEIERASREQYILNETAYVEETERILQRKQNQYELQVIFGQVLEELINEQIEAMIEHIFAQFTRLQQFSKEMAHKWIVNAVNAAEEENNLQSTIPLSRQYLQQLLLDRNRQFGVIEQDEAQINHRRSSVLTLIQKNDKESTSQNPMKQKQKQYEQLLEEGFSDILFSCETPAYCFSMRWIKKEELYWTENIRITQQNGDGAQHANIAKDVSASCIISSRDYQFVVIGTVDGHILMLHVASKQLIATTQHSRTPKNGKIEQLLISDHNKQIVSLDVLGTVCVYEVSNARQLGVKSHLKSAEVSAQIVRISFSSSLLLNGSIPSIMLGLQNGNILKWNTDVGAGVCILNGHSEFNGDTERHEYFQSHLSAICFIGCIDRISHMMLSIDIDGVVCIWCYEQQYQTTYGWFRPLYRYKVDVDYFTKKMTDGDEQQMKVVYEQTESKIPTQKYNIFIKEHLSQNHAFWRYQWKNNKNKYELLHIPRVVQDNLRYRVKSEVHPIDILLYSSKDYQLIRHYQQNYTQTRLKGRIFSAKFCSNQRDIIIAIFLEPYKADRAQGVRTKTGNELKIIQFRLLRYNDDKGSARISLDPFLVSMKQTHNNEWPIYDISKVWIPPCSDYLFVLMTNNLSVFSIETSQKVYSMYCSSSNSRFVLTADYVVFANPNNKTVEFNPMVDRNKMKSTSTWTNAVNLGKCSRVNRTKWQFRRQRRLFAAFKTDHHVAIRQIVQDIIDEIVA